MNPQFHTLVQVQVKAAKLYGKDSVENQQALYACGEWQDSCHHSFRKFGGGEQMCEHCNFPKDAFEERKYVSPEVSAETRALAVAATKRTFRLQTDAEIEAWAKALADSVSDAND